MPTRPTMKCGPGRPEALSTFTSLQGNPVFPSLKAGACVKALTLDMARLQAVWDLPREADAETWVRMCCAWDDDDNVPRLESGLPDLNAPEASPFVACYGLQQASLEFWRGDELLGDLLLQVRPSEAYATLWESLQSLLVNQETCPWWLKKYLGGSNDFGLLLPAELAQLAPQIEQQGPGLLAELSQQGHFTADLAELLDLICLAAVQEQGLLVVDGQ